jgi:RND family efflux transporter MFP subunit
MNSRAFRAWLSCSLLVLAGGPAGAADEPPEVPVARPGVREVADTEDFTGRTEAPTRVDLRARVTGYLQKALFQEGGEVKEGDTLFEIDPRPYRAECDRAEAAVGLAEAHLRLAKANLERTRALSARGAIGREDVDRAVAEAAEAEAGLRAAQANRDAARLNLEFTRVLAPVSGRIGRRLLDPGNLVKADETILATLVTRDPLYVYFDVDERTVLRLRRALADGPRGPRMPVAIGLAGEEGFPHAAVVDFTDNRVDPETGTLRLRAVLPNKDHLLDPGLFVRVRLTLGEPRKLLLVPAEAVLAEEGRRFVYVVNDKEAVEKREVVVEPERDGRRVVTRGLGPGDRVVVGRQARLRPGMTVRPVEADKADPRPEPPPGDSRPAAIRPAPRRPGPTVLVEAVYPGANAAVVADTVAAPIEQQVNGVEKLLSLRSRCTDDGRYTLAVTFARGVDLPTMQVLVQNRVSLALPVLPDVLKQTGVTVRRGAPGVQLIATLSSPGGRFDGIYLGNYAAIQLRDELARLPGVARVQLVGDQDYVLRLWLDLDRLAARKLSAADVVRALEEQNLKGAVAQPGRAAEGPRTVIDVPLLGRKPDPETLAGLVLKVDAEGRVVYLKDVARVELGAGRRDSQASLDGRPVVALVIHPAWGARPRTVSAAFRERLDQLRARLPEGLDLATPFDFTANLEAPDRPGTPECLLLDPDLPAGASPERRQRLLQRCEARLRGVPGVAGVLTLSENPFDLFGGGPCLLVSLAPTAKREGARDGVIRAVRTRLDEVKEMTVRLRDLSGPAAFPRCGYPVELAVLGPEAGPVRAFADKLAERLGRAGKLADVAANPDSTPRPWLSVDVDRNKAAALGVSLQDVFSTLQVSLGSYYVNDFNRFGRTWQVQIQAAPGTGDRVKDLRALKVRSAKGEMVPLGAFVAVRETEGPRALDRLDLRPMVEITANLGPGASADEVRRLCEKLGEEVRRELRLPAEYGLAWLREIPGPG